MRQCMEAGMAPAEFWDSSFSETLLVIRGYQSRVAVMRNETRLLIYTIQALVTKPEERGTVFDLYHIEGDPDPEEMMEAVRDSQEAAAVRQKEFNDQLRKEIAAQKETWARKQ